MLKELNLHTVDDEKKAQVIQLLEEFLEKAKRGEIESIMIVADEYGRDELDWGVTKQDDLVGLVGRLERLKHITLQRMEM